MFNIPAGGSRSPCGCGSVRAEAAAEPSWRAFRPRPLIDRKADADQFYAALLPELKRR